MYFLFALALPFFGLAQAPKHKQVFTPEQRINLHAKKLQLALDLEEHQIAPLKAVLRKYQTQKPERSENPRERNSEERYQAQMDRMEARLAFQKEMKTVLNEEQYAEWKRRMPIRHRSRTQMAYRKGKRGTKSRHGPVYKEHN